MALSRLTIIVICITIVILIETIGIETEAKFKPSDLLNIISEYSRIFFLNGFYEFSKFLTLSYQFICENLLRKFEKIGMATSNIFTPFINIYASVALSVKGLLDGFDGFNEYYIIASATTIIVLFFIAIMHIPKFKDCVYYYLCIPINIIEYCYHEIQKMSIFEASFVIIMMCITFGLYIYNINFKDYVLINTFFNFTK